MQPTDHDPEKSAAVEGEYLAPSDHPASGRNWRAAGGGVVGLGLLAAKFKGVIFALLNLKWILFASKFGLSGLSFLATVWFYSLYFGWKFAVAFVLLILLHEVGHAVFVRAYGLSVPGIYFIPGLGAFTTFSGGHTPYQEATIAFAGPLFGAIGALVCYGYGIATNEPFWLAVANITFVLNLFNMIPLGIFDGARIAGPISPKTWLGGAIVSIALAFAFHWWSLILALVLLLSIPRTISAWRGRIDARYESVTPAQRTNLGLAYFFLLAILSAGVIVSHVSVPGHPT